MVMPEKMSGARRPPLREIPLSAVDYGPRQRLATMSEGQWHWLLGELYDRGYTLLEVDANETAVRAFRRAEDSNQVVSPN
jgi:hypothetical protein